MANAIEKTAKLADSAGLGFQVNPGNHVQLRQVGVLVDYWPLSKRRTAIRNDGKRLENCNPEQAVDLCASGRPAEDVPSKPAGAVVTHVPRHPELLETRPDLQESIRTACALVQTVVLILIGATVVFWGVVPCS